MTAKKSAPTKAKPAKPVAKSASKPKTVAAKKAPAKKAAPAAAKAGASKAKSAKPAPKPAAKPLPAKAPASAKSSPAKAPAAKAKPSSTVPSKSAPAKSPAPKPAQSASAPAKAEKPAPVAPAKKAEPAVKKPEPAAKKPAPAPVAPEKKPAAAPDAAAPAKAEKPAAAPAKPTAGKKSTAAAGKSVKLKLKLKLKGSGPVQRPRPNALKPKTPVVETPPPPVLKSTLPADFIKQQKQILLDLRDAYINSMDGLAKQNLRGEGLESASAFGMHQADAGSDAYDRDFALSLLSQEQDALYEIEEAIKRIEAGSYGMCEMSYKAIPVVRLEAIPFARYTVECQEIIEKERKMNGGTFRGSRPVFGIVEEGEENTETPVEED